jgi:anti-sigma factor RsiW
VSTDPGLAVDCVDVVELITEYLEGALDPTTDERVTAHLALCEGCNRYLEQMRATIRTVGHVPLETLSDEARSTLLAAFRDRPD